MNRIHVCRINKLDQVQQSRILELVKNVFGVIVLPPIDYHYILTSDDRLIGYCAIKKRSVKIDMQEITVNLLGLFCVSSTFHRKGNGSKLLEFVKNDIDAINNLGIILNCGNSVEEFYIKNGFTKISESAMYIRNNESEIDNDPVYYYGSQISLKNYAVIQLGEDF